jgi:hypothetical protein
MKMKRRDFILASGSLLVPAIVTGKPCPPPRLNVTGGISATSTCPPAASSAYSTDFPLTENPLSEGGVWVDGKVIGLDWNNPQSISGRACASVRSGLSGNRYDDNIAHLNSASVAINANQYAQGTVYRASGYSPSGSKHEIELLLRFQITSHNARGYEVLWGHEGSFAIVRWNGPLGDYTDLGFSGPGPGVAVDGDVLRAEISGSVIKVYKNGALVGTGPSNSTWSDGQPGLGFWPVDSSTPEDYGWRRYEAGNL